MTSIKNQNSNENSNLQWTANIPPSYESISNNQIAGVSYQLPNGQHIYPSNIMHTNQPIENNRPIILTNQPIMSVPHSSRNYVTCQRPTYLNGIDINQINLVENYPTTYVVWHCILLIICAIAQITVEYYLVLSESPLYEATSGWYAGGLTIGCACFTFSTSEYYDFKNPYNY